MNTPVFVDTFSVGLYELPRRKQRDTVAVLRVLDREKRFSVFEATANQDIARTMDRIVRDGLITTDTSCGFPWTKCKLTEKGRAMLT